MTVRIQKSQKKIDRDIQCATCGKQLMIVYEDESYELLEDQGVCPKCGYLNCSACLNIPVGVFRNLWAVSYKGYKCNGCCKGGTSNGL